MKYCTYCHAELVENSYFCGNCGQAVNIPADGFTRLSVPGNAPITPAFPVSPAPPYSSNPQWSQNVQPYALGESNIPTLPISEEEEERRRRAALMGMGLLSMGVFPQGNDAPMVQGAPQMGGVPTVQGTPQMHASSFQSVQPGPQGGTIQVAPHTPPMHLPVSSAPEISSSPTLTLHHHPPGGSTSSSGSSAPKHGCGPVLIITAIIIPIVIIASIAGLGLTIFAPAITLNGSSSISIGASLSLHGSHFIPGSSISLERDGSTPVYVVSQHRTNATVQAIYPSSIQSALSTASAAVSLLNSSSSTINASSDGTFNVTITTDPTWTPGQHTITATETLTHRSANLSFTILSPFASPSPTTTKTTTPTPGKTPTTTPTSIPGASPTVIPTLSPTTTASSSQSTLSCVNPSSVTLGPVTENFAQAVTSQVALCASGSGTLQWKASWNASQASWLSLNTSTGQINAPGQAQIVMSANAAQLGPGKYSATITFSSASNNVTQVLNVTFVVQAGCLKGSPGTLTFSGVQNVSDPAPQTVGLTNCGAIGTWSAIITTVDGANWLSVSPMSNTLGGNGAPPETVTISASNLKAQLGSGTYNGSVTFSLGSSSFVVQVTLQVTAAPILSSSTSTLTGDSNCTNQTGGNYYCQLTLSNSSPSLSLTWTYSEQMIPGLILKVASFTIPPSQTEQVQIYIPTNDCSLKASITFTGTVNSVNVTWNCYIP
jgi:hypothetical protein